MKANVIATFWHRGEYFTAGQTFTCDDLVKVQRLVNAECLEQPEVNATVKARQLAEAKGIDLYTVTGSGQHGRVTVGDVREVVNGRS